MKRHFFQIFCLIISLLSLSAVFSPSVEANRHIPDNCQGRSLLGIPSWDRGICLDEQEELSEFLAANRTEILATNIIVILVSIAGLVAVAFIIVGGFLYVLASGNSEKAKNARQTIIHALVGLVIAIMARVVAEVVWRNLTADNPPSLETAYLLMRL
ncbi:MAG: pilin [Candidatus Saccharibacteria bacterium]|nr:pilin [Candidatus Saccharibacteria bacterium]MCY4088824.1 pilin [Candidatus Saccharibacteria bacterium]